MTVGSQRHNPISLRIQSSDHRLRGSTGRGFHSKKPWQLAGTASWRERRILHDLLTRERFCFGVTLAQTIHIDAAECTVVRDGIFRVVVEEVSAIDDIRTLAVNVQRLIGTDFNESRMRAVGRSRNA